VTKLEAAISPKTKAIMMAHTLGNPFDLDVITAICKKYGLWLIEDCCDALGSTYNGKHGRHLRRHRHLSFYPAHHITMGEGGAVFTNNPELKRSPNPSATGAATAAARRLDNTCGKRFCQCWVRCRRLRPQVHLQPPGLQPQDHRHAACGLAQIDRRWLRAARARTTSPTSKTA
jgi:CDP-6-deoxy-D-xylo-4-hexulose-3-dehydrase